MGFQSFLWSLVFLTVFTFQSIQSCVTDSECIADLGSPYAICVNGTCTCSDFFGVDIDFEGSLTCTKGVPIGSRCSRNVECQIINHKSKCIDKQCDCFDMVHPTGQVGGECFVIRNLTQPCDFHQDCVLGSNEFARCVDLEGESTCACHSSEEAQFVADSNGQCYIPVPKECAAVMSVLAITMSISVGIFVLLVVLYMVTSRVKEGGGGGGMKL